MPKKDDAASASAVAKVRAHYSLEQEQEQREEGSIRRSWDDEEVEERKDELAEDRLTRAISDALFVYPFYRMLKTAGDSTPNRVFAYKYSHRGEVSLTQIISTASNARSPKKTSSSSSHFDEVLIQFENKVCSSLIAMLIGFLHCLKRFVISFSFLATVVWPTPSVE